MTARTCATTAKDAAKPEPLNGMALDSRDSPVFDGAMSPGKAARRLSDKLTFYEKKEIESYPEIYYVGQNCKAKIKAPASGANDGYDTDSGEYVIVEGDHIAYRYEILCHLGSGAFGQVVKATDHATGTEVAIKLIRNKKKVAYQAKTEVKILEHINEKDPHGKYNIVRMLSNFTFRSHMCIVYELLGTNLYDHMDQTQFYPMALNSVRKIAARMLVALTFLWKENIIHCDLKPENVLYKTDASSDCVKVADLGSACYDSRCAYTYIQSRFYRAPEVILGLPYGRPIDLWSFGCILCELATGYPLFPGENEKDQLACIMEYLGKPPTNMIQSCKKRRTYFSDDLEPKIVPNSKGRVRKPGSKTLPSFLGLDTDDLFISFLDQFLCWEPGDRVPPRQAMRHPWIEEEFVFTIARPKLQVDALAEENAAESSLRERSAADSRPAPAAESNGDLGSPRRSRPAMLNFEEKSSSPSKDGNTGGGDDLASGRSLIVADHHVVNIAVPASVRQAKLSNSLSRSVHGGATDGTEAQRTPVKAISQTEAVARLPRSSVQQQSNGAATASNAVGSLWSGVAGITQAIQRRTSLPRNSALSVGVQPRGTASTDQPPTATTSAREAYANETQAMGGQLPQPRSVNGGWQSGRDHGNGGPGESARASFVVNENGSNGHGTTRATRGSGGNVAALIDHYSGNTPSKGDKSIKSAVPSAEDTAATTVCATRGERAKTATMENHYVTEEANHRRRASEVFPPITSTNSRVPVTVVSVTRAATINNSNQSPSYTSVGGGPSGRSTRPLSSRRHEYAQQRQARRSRQSEMTLVPEPEATSLGSHLPPI